jgi:hypothetical protein
LTLRTKKALQKNQFGNLKDTTLKERNYRE